MRRMLIHDLKTGEFTLQEYDGSTLTVRQITPEEYAALRGCPETGNPLQGEESAE